MYPAPFNYHRPESLQAAIALLARYGDDAKVMAGGQSLIAMMKLRMGETAQVIDIGRLADLSYIEERGDKLCIGALLTHAEIGASVLAQKVPALADAGNGIADRQVRNMGTIGGGLCVADASGDWPTSLRCLDVKVVIRGVQGVRQVSIADFVLDSYSTCLASDEIVTEVQVPLHEANSSSAYVAFKRSAAAFPTSSAGMQLTMDGDRCKAASIVLGCAGPAAVVSADANDCLVGKVIDSESLQEAADLIVAVSEPPPDARGSVVFKRAMSKSLVVEAGLRALARCRGEVVKGGHRYA